MNSSWFNFTANNLIFILYSDQLQFPLMACRGHQTEREDANLQNYSHTRKERCHVLMMLKKFKCLKQWKHEGIKGKLSWAEHQCMFEFCKWKQKSFYCSRLVGLHLVQHGAKALGRGAAERLRDRSKSRIRVSTWDLPETFQLLRTTRRDKTSSVKVCRTFPFSCFLHGHISRLSNEIQIKKTYLNIFTY